MEKMYRDEFMKFERLKAVNRALAELENASNTFYGEFGFKELLKIKEDLQKLKDDHLM